jgi:hypothetical protein
MKRLRILLPLAVAIPLVQSLPGCKREGGASQPHQKSLRVIVFVDLTTSTTIRRGGRKSSRVPSLTASAVEAASELSEEAEVTISVRAITHQSYSETYVISHTCGQNRALDLAFQRRAQATVRSWINEYEKRGVKGTDIYGALQKLATLTETGDENTPIAALFISDFRHEGVLDPGRPRFRNARRVHVLAVLSNDQGSPSACEQARQEFQRRVEQAGGRDNHDRPSYYLITPQDLATRLRSILQTGR